MSFFDLKPPEDHKCELPNFYERGKGWRCDCGKAYVIDFYPVWDVQPGETNWHWIRSSEYDTEAVND